MTTKIDSLIKVLRDVPDPAFYRPDAYYAIMTKWYENVRVEAVREAHSDR